MLNIYEAEIVKPVLAAMVTTPADAPVVIDDESAPPT
jgi:hypothetical protein